MKILVVDDDQSSRKAASLFLRRPGGHEVVACSSADEALALLEKNDFPMVLSDIRMPGMSGIELLKKIKSRPESWKTDVVLFTGYGDMKSAIEALRAGAYDYILKPVDAHELAILAERIGEHQALLRENRHLCQNFEAEVRAATDETKQGLSWMKKLMAESIVGQVGVFSEKLLNVIIMAQKYHADPSIPVLIEGETGTGKEIIARIVHFGFDSSLKQTDPGPFVDLNCAAIAPTLFESELFGYETGAFTGSNQQGQKGKLDLAQGGTLFLDEIGEMPQELQVKLLRVIQEKEFYRVGGLKKIKTDARLVCATNVNLKEQMETRGFRRDLYYRLQVGHIVVPPLRERRAEIIPLAGFFLRQIAKQRGKKEITISEDTAALLQEYDWPGNVRELRNAMEFFVFMFDEDKIKPRHLDAIIKKEEHGAATADAPAIAAGHKNNLCLPLPPEGFPLKKYNDIIVNEILSMHGGNHEAAAKYLGISLRSLYYRTAKEKESRQ